MLPSRAIFKYKDIYISKVKNIKIYTIQMAKTAEVIIIVSDKIEFKKREIIGK